MALKCKAYLSLLHQRETHTKPQGSRLFLCALRILICITQVYNKQTLAQHPQKMGHLGHSYSPEHRAGLPQPPCPAACWEQGGLTKKG